MPHKYSVEDLCRYRFEQAQQSLGSAKHNLGFDLKTSLNRSYYSIMYAVKALLAADKLDAHSHRGLFIVFNKEYIKTGKIDKKYSEILKEASMIRDKSDYDDFYIVSKDEAREQVVNAESFLMEISKNIEAMLNISLKQ